MHYRTSTISDPVIDGGNHIEMIGTQGFTPTNS